MEGFLLVYPTEPIASFASSIYLVVRYTGFKTPFRDAELEDESFIKVSCCRNIRARLRETMVVSGKSAFYREKWMLGLAVLLMCGVLGFLYFRVCDSQMVGFLHDDGVYALTAKALAEGKGYQLLNLAGPGVQGAFWQVKYPIFYPLLLSVAWLIQPDFPQNLPWMQTLTLSFAVIGLAALYFYLRHMKRATWGISLAIVLLVASNFYFIYYSTALMSEAPYFLLSVLALWMADAYVQRPTQLKLASLLILSVLLFHTRTIGLSLILAVWLLLLLRRSRKIALGAGVVMLLLTIAPWLWWVKTHGVRLTTLNYPLAYVYGGYGLEYGINSPHEGLAYLQAVIQNGFAPIINSLPNLLFPQLAFWLSPSPLASWLFSLLLAGLLFLPALHAIRKRDFSVSGCYVGFYILFVGLWMYPNQAMRFLAVLLPWLWLLIIQSSVAIGKFCLGTRIPQCLNDPIRKRAACLMGIPLSLFLLWPGYAGYQLLFNMRSRHLLEPSGRSALLWKDYQDTFQFLKSSNYPLNGRIAGMWDPVYYLYTDHPTFGLFSSSLQRINGQVTAESFQHLRTSLMHYGVKAMVVEPFLVNQQWQAPQNPVAVGLLKTYPQEFERVYTAPSGLMTVYTFHPIMKLIQKN
jgi:hypothetical protein